MGRSVFYFAAMALLFVAFKLFGWWGFGVIVAFACGFHLCYRLIHGRWMDPEN